MHCHQHALVIFQGHHSFGGRRSFFWHKARYLQQSWQLMTLPPQATLDLLMSLWQASILLGSNPNAAFGTASQHFIKPHQSGLNLSDFLGHKIHWIWGRKFCQVSSKQDYKPNYIFNYFKSDAFNSNHSKITVTHCLEWLIALIKPILCLCIHFLRRREQA